jgi:glutamate/tyrosine decarboxylase-like PLP-dependent enzyme
MCDACLEARKSLNRQKRDQTLEDLIKQNREIADELKRQKEINAQLTKELNSRPPATLVIDYNSQLEKEHVQLQDMAKRLRLEIEQHVRDKAEYEMTHQQLRLDQEKLLLEMKRLETEIKDVKSINLLLTKENELK